VSVASRRVEPIDAFAELDAVFEIYCAALNAPAAAVETQRWRDETLPRHAQRRDFIFLGAREADRKLVGIAYGYTGEAGQWWNDLVAAALDDETRRAWLEPPHFEVVELHVHPERQRQGTGTRLLDELLRRQPHDRAVLTADPARPQSLPFYGKHGWQSLGDVCFAAGSPARVVLGKRLERQR
jgi:GNAT superfamily N-acetyltransferase